jgi:hypothetical protein
MEHTHTDQGRMTTAGRAGLVQRIHAALLARGAGRHERCVAERKRALFAGIGGTVLEIGPGAGPNLAYFPPGIRWIGVEPNLLLHPHLLRATGHQGIDRPGAIWHQDALPICNLQSHNLQFALESLRRCARRGSIMEAYDA